MKSLLQNRKWAEFKALHGWRNYLIDDILDLEKIREFISFTETFIYAYAYAYAYAWLK